MDAPATKADLVSPRDQEIIVMMLQCIKGGEPKIDYARLGAAAGMTTKSATNWWCALRKKLQLSFGADGAVAGSVVAGKASPTKRAPRKSKKAAAAESAGDGASGAADVLTPPSTPPATGRKRKAAVLDKDKDGGDSTDGTDSTDGKDDKNGTDASDKGAEDKAAAPKDSGNDATMADAGQDGQAKAVSAATEDAKAVDGTAVDSKAGDGLPIAAPPATAPADASPVAPKKKRATTPRARGGGRARGKASDGGATIAVAGRGDVTKDVAKDEDIDAV